jgi:hypothetical protein
MAICFGYRLFAVGAALPGADNGSSLAVCGSPFTVQMLSAVRRSVEIRSIFAIGYRSISYLP